MLSYAIGVESECNSKTLQIWKNESLTNELIIRDYLARTTDNFGISATLLSYIREPTL